MKNYPLLLIVLLSTLFSCKKADFRDDYVGEWNYQNIGSITLYQNGASIGTAPVSDNGTFNVEKSGDKDFLIGGKLFVTNGNKLSSNPMATNETNNGVNMVGTMLSDGQFSIDLIVIENNITGSWSNTNGAAGNYAGATTLTLKR